MTTARWRTTTFRHIAIGLVSGTRLGGSRSTINLNDNMIPNDVPIFDDSESAVLNPNGDVYAILEMENGDYYLAPLATLVCKAHVGPQPTPEHVPHHKDGDVTNNRADNLEWRIPTDRRRAPQPYRLLRASRPA
jgi:hypothetical protein